MQIQRENSGKHAITGYSAKSIRIADTDYCHSILVNKQEIKPWLITALKQLVTVDDLTPILELKPDVIIIGVDKIIPLPIAVLQHLATLRIGIEVMPLAAACRTFNILLGEDREVAGAFICG